MLDVGVQAWGSWARAARGPFSWRGPRPAGRQVLLVMRHCMGVCQSRGWAAGLPVPTLAWSGLLEDACRGEGRVWRWDSGFQQRLQKGLNQGSSTVGAEGQGGPGRGALLRTGDDRTRAQLDGGEGPCV